MGFDVLTDWVYADGNIILLTARLISLIFCLECFAYIVSIIANITKTAVR